MPLPRERPAQHTGTPPPPVHVYIKRGDRYQPVDAARLDLEDRTVTLTPPGGAPLMLTTTMVARANYDKTRVVLVLSPRRLGPRRPLPSKVVPRSMRPQGVAWPMGFPTLPWTQCTAT